MYYVMRNNQASLICFVNFTLTLLDFFDLAQSAYFIF